MNAFPKYAGAFWRSPVMPRVGAAATSHRAAGAVSKAVPTHDDFRPLRRLLVTRALQTTPGMSCRGRLIAGRVVIPCALGAGGIVHRKREGDTGTPAGRLALLRGFFRPDRTPRPRSLLSFVPLRVTDGWCDDVSASLYNQLVCLPLRHRHEKLWREDRLYDTVIVLNYNMKPRSKGRGSAIFFHLADEPLSATAGCVAVSESDMRRLLPRLGRDAVMIIR